MCCNHSYVIKYTALAGTSVVYKLSTITLQFNAVILCIVYVHVTKIYKNFMHTLLSIFSTKHGINFKAIISTSTM